MSIPKTTVAGALACVMALSSCTQNQNTVQTKERTIEVSGSAEKEVAPDELYFTITLQEYKKSGKKVTLDEMEKSLVARALSIGIKKEDLKLDNLSAYSYNYYWYGYGYSKKRDDIMATGTYRIKVKDTGQMDKMLEKNENVNVTYAYISNFSCSQKEKYYEELREKAVKATRHKASKLLAAVGEELGPVVSITDEGAKAQGNPYPYYYYGYEEKQVNSLDVATTQSAEPSVSPRNIKLRAEMRVVYRIR